MNRLGTQLYFWEQSARRVQKRFLLSIISGMLIIVLFTGVLITKAPASIEKTNMLSIFTMAVSDGRLNVIEHLAFSGDWLDETVSSGPEPRWDYGRRLSAEIGYFRQGAMHIKVYKRSEQAASPEWWTIRPAIKKNDAPTVLWVCGSRQPPKGFHALGEDLTTMPPEANYWLCQSASQN